MKGKNLIKWSQQPLKRRLLYVSLIALHFVVMWSIIRFLIAGESLFDAIITSILFGIWLQYPVFKWFKSHSTYSVGFEAKFAFFAFLCAYIVIMYLVIFG